MNLHKNIFITFSKLNFFKLEKLKQRRNKTMDTHSIYFGTNEHMLQAIYTLVYILCTKLCHQIAFNWKEHLETRK